MQYVRVLFVEFICFREFTGIYRSIRTPVLTVVGVFSYASSIVLFSVNESRFYSAGPLEIKIMFHICNFKRLKRSAAR
jgi:hypothetical protein